MVKFAKIKLFFTKNSIANQMILKFAIYLLNFKVKQIKNIVFKLVYSNKIMKIFLIKKMGFFLFQKNDII